MLGAIDLSGIVADNIAVLKNNCRHGGMLTMVLTSELHLLDLQIKEPKVPTVPWHCPDQALRTLPHWLASLVLRFPPVSFPGIRFIPEALKGFPHRTCHWWLGASGLEPGGMDSEFFSPGARG